MDSRSLSHPLHRAGSALASVTASNRGRTEPQRHEKHTLHRRFHSNTVTSRTRAHSTRHHVKDAVVHSAAELRPPISFDHILRRDKKSPDSSRRGSASAAHRGDQQQQGSAQQHEIEQKQNRVKAVDVAKAKKENEKREAELRRQLQNVEESAMSSTRQLDDTHYTILEKASTLRSIVEGLRHLAEEARSTRKMLDSESRELAENTETSLDAFHGFEQQETNINELIKRLTSSKAATEKLNERLEAARQRVGAKDMAYELDGFGTTLATAGDALMEGIASPVSELIMASASEDPRLKKLFDEL
nr:hypothetical protein CFP56_10075 [Quercus suber]